MSNTYEICFTGQIDSISPEDVDFILQIEVTDVVNTKGNFSRFADTPEEFHGEKYLEWEAKSGSHDFWFDDANYYQKPLTEYHVAEVSQKYHDKIEELLWEAIDTACGEEYIDAHEPRYLEE